jgi:excisionase family DNA binding protein
MEAQRLYTMNEACQQLRISRSELYRALERREIVATKIGRAVRFTPFDLDAYVARKREESVTAATVA